MSLTETFNNSEKNSYCFASEMNSIHEKIVWQSKQRKKKNKEKKEIKSNKNKNKQNILKYGEKKFYEYFIY